MNWKQILGGGLTLIATIATILGVGYAIGKDHNEALVDFLREKNQAFESSEKTLRAEVENLKVELKSARISTINLDADIYGKTVAEATANGTLNVNPKPYSTPVTVPSERTVSLFDDQLLITVQGIRFEGSPLRHRVYATIGKPGKPNKELNGVDPGFVIVYEGFEVRIVETDTFYAKFAVMPLAPAKT